MRRRVRRTKELRRIWPSDYMGRCSLIRALDVNLKSREFDLLGYDLLLPIGCVNLGEKFAFCSPPAGRWTQYKVHPCPCILLDTNKDYHRILSSHTRSIFCDMTCILLGAGGEKCLWHPCWGIEGLYKILKGKLCSSYTVVGFRVK